MLAGPQKLVLQSSLALAIVVAAGWAYFPTVAGLVSSWNNDPNYSHGFLVPILAAGLLWFRGREMPRPAVRPDVPGGLSLLGVAAASRAVGSYYYVNSLDHLSLLVTIAGLALLLAGRGWLLRGWPALAILVFTLPIPSAVGGSNVIAGLQEVATRASTFALQLLGTTAYRDGNVILLRTIELGVVEACSGLKMLMVFCALAVATAVLLPVGPVRRGIVILSAVPLALTCNVVRITAAGLAGEALGSDTGHFVFHDLAGWLMVPLAFALLTAEVLLLSRLVQPNRPAAV